VFPRFIRPLDRRKLLLVLLPLRLGVLPVSREVAAARLGRAVCSLAMRTTRRRTEKVCLAMMWVNGLLL